MTIITSKLALIPLITSISLIIFKVTSFTGGQSNNYGIDNILKEVRLNLRNLLAPCNLRSLNFCPYNLINIVTCVVVMLVTL